MSLLVPASLVVLLALTAFTLLSYRGAIETQVEERRNEALRFARSAAAELAVASAASSQLSVLRRYSAVDGAYLATPSGNLVMASGEDLPGGLLDPFAGGGDGGESDPPRIGDGRVAGPDATTGGRVIAVVPATLNGQSHLLRVDLDAGLLAAQRRGLTVLTVVVSVAGGGVVLLLILFLRQLLAPYDHLVARARQLSSEVSGEEDDVELLVRTFERGVAALAAGRPGGLDPGGTDGALKGGEETATDADLAALQRTLAASLESGLLLLDRRGAVVALNPAGAALLRVPVPATGTPLATGLAPNPGLVELLASAVESGQAVQRREHVLTLADGGAVPLGLSVHPLRRVRDVDEAKGVPAADEIRGYLVLFADLTEARRQGEEARLGESLARLGELAAGVAHELRNSLATMRGYLTLMERSPDDAPGAYLLEVRREADHLQRVLEDFLAFARPGSARVEELSLVAIAERAAADPALEGSAVDVVAAPGTPTLRGDPQMLERAVRNLLRNAHEAQREAGVGESVTVRVGPLSAAGEGEPGGGVELSVFDRGGGVPEALADRLFHPFVTGRPGGVGLGLALSHRIVDLHGGTLRLDPRPGGGTVARITFPAEAVAGRGVP